MQHERAGNPRKARPHVLSCASVGRDGSRGRAAAPIFWAPRNAASQKALLGWQMGTNATIERRGDAFGQRRQFMTSPLAAGVSIDDGGPVARNGSRWLATISKARSCVGAQLVLVPDSPEIASHECDEPFCILDGGSRDREDRAHSGNRRGRRAAAQVFGNTDAAGLASRLFDG